MWILEGPEGGPGYPNTAGRPFLSVSWPASEAPNGTRVIARGSIPTSGKLELPIPAPLGYVDRLVQGVVFAGPGPEFPGIAVSPAYRTGDDEHPRPWRDLDGLFFAVAGLLAATSTVVFMRSLRRSRRKPGVAIAATASAFGVLLACVPRFSADPAESLGRRGDVIPLVPHVAAPRPAAVALSTPVDTLLARVPPDGVVRIAPMSTKGEAREMAARAARLLRPRRVVWVDPDGPVDVLATPGWTLAFGPTPDPMPAGTVLLASAPGVFAVEVLPR